MEHTSSNLACKRKHNIGHGTHCMQSYSIDIQKIQHATPTSTYALFAAAGPESAQPPKAQARVDACARSACCYSSRIPSHSGCTPSRNRRKVESDLSPIPGAQPAPCAHASDMRVCAWLRAERAGTRGGIRKKSIHFFWKSALLRTTPTTARNKRDSSRAQTLDSVSDPVHLSRSSNSACCCCVCSCACGSGAA